MAGSLRVREFTDLKARREQAVDSFFFRQHRSAHARVRCKPCTKNGTRLQQWRIDAVPNQVGVQDHERKKQKADIFRGGQPAKQKKTIAEQRLTTTSFPFDPVRRRNSSSPEISCTIAAASFFTKWTVCSSRGTRRGGWAKLADHGGSTNIMVPMWNRLPTVCKPCRSNRVPEKLCVLLAKGTPSLSQCKQRHITRVCLRIRVCCRLV